MNCPAASNTDLLGGSDEPTIQVQLNTLGGQIYLVPLSVLAARNLLLALSNWRPAVEAVQKKTALRSRSRNSVGLLRSDLYFAKHPDELVIMAQLRNGTARGASGTATTAAMVVAERNVGRMAVTLFAAMAATYLARAADVILSVKSP